MLPQIVSTKEHRFDRHPPIHPTADRRIGALTVLLDVALQLGPEHDLGQILQIVTSGICQASLCERASLFLVDEAAAELYTHVATELEIREIRMGMDEGICGWVASHRQIAHVSDPPHDDRWNSSVDMRTGYVTRNILAAPVISNLDDRLVGVLQVLNKAHEDFDAFDHQLIQAFAAHAATALERRRMQEELLRGQEFKHSLEMGRKIQRGFLPDRLPDVPGYDVAPWWQPATFVSGDYYDWLPLPDGRTCFVMGDVSGHGLGHGIAASDAARSGENIRRTGSDRRTAGRFDCAGPAAIAVHFFPAGVPRSHHAHRALRQRGSCPGVALSP
jgi:sigma-B regulation protein RsbU (phosphoserine phosphatase)